MASMNARILLWGIEGSGKSTTLETIHNGLRPELRGDLRREATRLDPTVEYESLSIRLGEMAGVGTQIDLIAVPGAADQAMTRKQLLDEIDGVVLVLDCAPDRIESNFDAIAELKTSLAAYGRRLDAIPIVLQYNKRDVADPFAIEDLHRRIGLDQAAVFETIATTGHGVMPTLTTIAKHVVRARRGASGEFAAPLTSETSAASIPVADAEMIAEPLEVSDAQPVEATPFADTTESSETADVIAIAELEEDKEGLLESPLAVEASDETHDILEAAILAEGAAMDDDIVIDGFGREAEVDLSDDLMGEAKPALGGDLRVVSVGQAELQADGGIRLPLVLGDEAGDSRSVVLSLRIDGLHNDGND